MSMRVSGKQAESRMREETIGVGAGPEGRLVVGLTSLLACLVQACNFGVPPIPTVAPELEARIEHPTASVHDEAAVRAGLGRGVRVDAVPEGGFLLRVALPEIEQFGLPAEPVGGICVEAEAPHFLLEMHYDKVETALREMTNLNFSTEVDRGYDRDCAVVESGLRFATWRTLRHHAILGPSYTSEVGLSVKINEAERTAAELTEGYFVLGGVFGAKGTLEAGAFGWELAAMSMRMRYDVACTAGAALELRTTSGGAVRRSVRDADLMEAYVDVVQPEATVGWSLRWARDAGGESLELVGQDGRLACRAEGETWDDVTVRCEGEGEAYAFAWSELESRFDCF